MKRNGLQLINDEFVLSNGLIQIGDMDEQIIDNIVQSNRGDFKEAPFVGAETIRMLNGNNSSVYAVNLENQLKQFDISRKVTVSSDGIKVAL